jgi:hypothetical protein
MEKGNKLHFNEILSLFGFKKEIQPFLYKKAFISLPKKKKNYDERLTLFLKKKYE